ncbi:orotate phosphoribosyltransferase [Sphingomonas sp.]|jgi:orotate phosphoribosyltransferase|uniref:orotate phosphoribosyltransferase n=1 Tax=Sphingomonas sp. TaxID=28214 RepID=UPI002E32EF22|nr:orotate phosphoribosyltransferase [Sphingomonas sp.]HEX4694400.1 orotate phosphoribosyltransferase [Sphingomonas sp.]
MTGSYDREALRALLAKRTFKRGEFLLVSGKRSRIYFNMKATMMTPEGAAQCARGLLSVLDGLEADHVAGLEMGAVPLLGGIAALSWEQGRPIGTVFVRKAAKAHGTALMVEGLDDAGGESLAGKRVVLIDDVATSGGSILKAAEQIEATGGVMTDAIVILDREQGATATLAERGITLHTLFTATDLGVSEEDRQPLD